MSLYTNNVTIGGLIVAPAIAADALLPVFYSGATYKITVGDLLAQVTKASIGLGNADNTSDANKPISTATAAALATKSDISHVHNVAQITGLAAALSEKALINHMHPITEVVGLSAALDAKAEVIHQHEITGVNGLGAALNAKADANHVHEISGVNGLSLALTAKADTVVVNTQLAAKADTVTVAAQLANKADTVTVNSQLALKADTTTVNAQLALKADSADVNAQLALKAPLAHMHTYADIAELDTDITDLFDGLDGKAPLNHTHVAANVSDFDQAVRTSVLSYLAEGTNINLVDEGPNLIINSTGGSGGTSNYNAAKIFLIGGDVMLYPDTHSQNNVLDQQIVLGRDIVSYESYVGDNFTINEVGIFRINIQTTAEVSSYIFSGENNDFVPAAFTKASLPIKHGHAIRNYSGLNILGTESSYEHSLHKTQASYGNNTNQITSWNNEFYVQVYTAPATITLSSLLGFDPSVQDGTDVNIGEWLAFHNTTVLFEAMAEPGTSQAKASGIYGVLDLNKYYAYPDTSNEIYQWSLNNKYGSDLTQFDSDYYNGTIFIKTSGTYRVTVTTTATRATSDPFTYPSDTLSVLELTTRAENYSSARVLSDRIIKKKKIVDVRDFENSPETWVAEYIVSAQNNSELTVACNFSCSLMITLGWFIDYRLVVSLERLGDAAPAPM